MFKCLIKLHESLNVLFSKSIFLLMVLFCSAIVIFPVFAVEPQFLVKDTKSPYYVSPVVNVIISGEDSRHVIETLERAVILSRKVPVRNVLIVTTFKDLYKYQTNLDDIVSRVGGNVPAGHALPENSFTAFFKDLKLSRTEVKPVQEVENRLGIRNSPSWIVRFEGKEYIYEGYTDIGNMFSKEGIFTPK
jgi:hypothetical protein